MVSGRDLMESLMVSVTNGTIVTAVGTVLKVGGGE